MYEKIQKKASVASPIQNHVLRQNTGFQCAPKFLFNDIRIRRTSAVPAQFKTTQQKTVPCIQFEKADIIKRIVALLNLDAKHHDRNNALYRALTTAGIDRATANGLDQTEVETLLLGIEENKLTQVEQILINRNSNRTFEDVYSSLDKPNVSGYFSTGFNENHFADNFDQAFQISKYRFLHSTTIPASTVLYAFQKDSFWTNEYSSIRTVTANSEFTTKHSYYFWHFTRDNIKDKELRDIPPESPLRNISYATVKLMANERGKIYHLAGTGGVIKEVPHENKDTAVKKIQNACKILKKISNKAGIPLLAEIYSYINSALNNLGNPEKSETRVIYALGISIHNFLNALMASDYETFYHGNEPTGSDYVIPHSSYFDGVRINLMDINTQTYFSLRGCQSTLDNIIHRLNDIKGKYSHEELSEEEQSEEES